MIVIYVVFSPQCDKTLCSRKLLIVIKHGNFANVIKVVVPQGERDFTFSQNSRTLTFCFFFMPLREKFTVFSLCKLYIINVHYSLLSPFCKLATLLPSFGKKISLHANAISRGLLMYYTSSSQNPSKSGREKIHSSLSLYNIIMRDDKAQNLIWDRLLMLCKSHLV